MMPSDDEKANGVSVPVLHGFLDKVPFSPGVTRRLRTQ